MITAATAIDKARLMEGLSTENISIRELVPQIQEKLSKFQEVYGRAISMLQKKDGSFEPNIAADVSEA